METSTFRWKKNMEWSIKWVKLGCIAYCRFEHINKEGAAKTIINLFYIPLSFNRLIHSNIINLASDDLTESVKTVWYLVNSMSRSILGKQFSRRHCLLYPKKILIIFLMFNIYTIQHFTFKVYNKKHEFKIKVKHQASKIPETIYN